MTGDNLITSGRVPNIVSSFLPGLPAVFRQLDKSSQLEGTNVGGLVLINSVLSLILVLTGTKSKASRSVRLNSLSLWGSMRKESPDACLADPSGLGDQSREGRCPKIEDYEVLTG
jgi:hypothetical protein